jgi:hypothetical protein
MPIETGGSRGGNTRDGRYISAVVGNAVESLVDGSVSGTDNSPAHRAEMVRAIAQGKRLHLPEGRYIWKTQQVALAGECTDGGGITGVPGRTIVYVLTGDQASNFHCLTFDGDLAVDGVNGIGPVTYYTTAPAAKRATTVQLNNLANLFVGQWIMFVDRKNYVSHYSFDIVGTKVGNKGQMVRIESIGAFGPFVSNILSGTIDADGILTIVNAAPAHVYGIDAEITLSNLTGTGDFALLEGAYVTIAPTVGTVTTVQADGEFADGTTITSGIISYGTPAPNSITFYPALLEAISGSDTGDPQTETTNIRRITRHPKNVLVEGIIFRQSKTEPAKNTQAAVVLNALDEPRVKQLEVHGRLVGLSIGNGTHHFDVDDYLAQDGGPLGYGMTITGGACYGRIKARGFNGRHLVNTVASLVSTCIPRAIRVMDSDCDGMALSGFADHPGVDDLVYSHCRSTGGRSSIAYGFQVRGTNGGLVECEGFACAIGANIAYGNGSYIRGGYYRNNGANLQITRAVNTIIDNPILEDPISTNLRMYLQNTTSPYDVAYPGVNARVILRGDEPPLGDFNLVRYNANFPMPFDFGWRFRTQIDGRVPTYRVVQNDLVTLAQVAFPEELAGRKVRKYDDFTVPSGLDAEYLVETKNKSVVATLPDPRLFPGQRIVIRHTANTAPFTLTVAATIDGVVNRVLAPGAKLVVYSDSHKYHAVSATYNNVSGLVTATMFEAVPFTTNKAITVANAAGTGSFASINGARTTLGTLSVNQKTVRFTIGTGLTMTITGADIYDGVGWSEE